MSLGYEGHLSTKLHPLPLRECTSFTTVPSAVREEHGGIVLKRMYGLEGDSQGEQVNQVHMEEWPLTSMLYQFPSVL